MCHCRKTKSIKQQEASGYVTSLGKKKPLCKVPVLGPLLF